jgi:hypothetical protein
VVQEEGLECNSYIEIAFDFQMDVGIESYKLQMAEKLALKIVTNFGFMTSYYIVSVSLLHDKIIMSDERGSLLFLASDPLII